MSEEKKKSRKKKRKIGTGTLIIFAVICIVLAVFSLVHDFKKMNRAAGYSEKILNLYLNSNDKK